MSYMNRKKIISNYFLVLLILIFSFTGCKTTKYSKKDIDYFRPNKWENKNGFSIAIIPDSQQYVDFLNQKPFKKSNTWKIFYEQTKFLSENSIYNGGDFSFAIHVGDVIEHRSHVFAEWNHAVKCMNNLDGTLPFLIIPGNHDYDMWIDGHQDSGSFMYNYNFGPNSNYFRNKDWYKGSSKNGRNSYCIFDCADTKMLVIGLEVNPDEKTINWAQDILNQYSDLPCILVTHVYISVVQEKAPAGSQPKTIQSNGSSYLQGVNYLYVLDDYRKNHNGYTAIDLWNNFISKNNQIFMVICGHVSGRIRGSGYRIDKNDDGYTTYSIVSDFQSWENGGDGWFTILDFDLENKVIEHSCYSSRKHIYLQGEPFEMSFPIDWDWNERLGK